MKKLLCVNAMALLFMAASAQDASLKILPLDNLSAFKAQAGNWQIVGDVSIDPTIDIHEHAKTDPVENSKKKKSKDQPPAVQKVAVTFKPGSGVLLNINDETKKDQLVTNFEHGDIELEFDVMLPKGSNSGVYLQGRYEVQLLDSWGVMSPKYSDIGGIYRNWESEPGKIYMGKAPLSNPAKAPGLWQNFKISFRAPRFDANGNKISNAKFVYVDLNGVRIHNNVEVPLPTGGPLENNEKAFGPLMIQGDHGPVAIRNIKYHLKKDAKITASPIAYKTYNGKFKSVSDFSRLTPATSGVTPELTCEVLETENEYGSSYSGTITLPEDGTYTFEVEFTGGITFLLDGEQLIDLQRPDEWTREKATSKLKAGTYPFEIYNFKDATWSPPRLAFYVSSENISQQRLHAFNSYPQDQDPVAPILINAGSTPKLLRAFLDFKGERKNRLTHTIGVGDPSGTHYVYDLKAGNLVCVWHGDFVNATPMWHDRGDGSFIPMGAAQYFSMSQPLAFLENENASFPLTGVENEFIGKGYVIDPQNGRPTFKYIYKGMDVEDKVYPDDNNRAITHEVVIKNKAQGNLFYKLAEGKDIVAIQNNMYVIGDKEYYIKVNGQPIIRTVNGLKELVLKLDNVSTVQYSVIW